jgi:Protein of unknown function (DUF2842)
MTIRQRRFVGIILTVIFIIVYALIAMAVGGMFIVGRGILVELIGFILLGIGWVPVAMWLIKWMSPRDAER